MRGADVDGAIVGALVVAAALAVQSVGSAEAPSTRYAAPDGRPNGTGTVDRPWDLQTALSGSAGLQPGDTLLLRGGRYVGAFSSALKGREGAPIVIAALPGEQPVLDEPTFAGSEPPAVLSINGAHVIVRDLEVTSSNPERVGRVRPVGIDVRAPHTRLINNVVHDAGVCIGHWATATDAEIQGNILYFCGWDDTDRGHGHGLYIQNGGGPKVVSGNILFDQFDYNIHAYSEASPLDDLTFRENVAFGAGALSRVTPFGGSNLLVGGRVVPHRTVLERNFTYSQQGVNQLGVRAGSSDTLVRGNVFAEGVEGVALLTMRAENLTLKDNTFVGAVTESMRRRENRFEATPRGHWIYVLPHGADANRVTVVVYNWERADSLSMAAPDFLKAGDRYELRNVQDYRRDIVSRVHDGGPIALPMQKHTVAAPAGLAPPAGTFPVFGVFVLVRTS